MSLDAEQLTPEPRCVPDRILYQLKGVKNGGVIVAGREGIVDRPLQIRVKHFSM